MLPAAVWPETHKRYCSNIMQVWRDARNGNMPIHGAGSRLEYVDNDGSPEWDELQKRAQEGPVFSAVE